MKVVQVLAAAALVAVLAAAAAWYLFGQQGRVLCTYSHAPGYENPAEPAECRY